MSIHACYEYGSGHGLKVRERHSGRICASLARMTSRPPIIDASFRVRPYTTYHIEQVRPKPVLPTRLDKWCRAQSARNLSRKSTSTDTSTRNAKATLKANLHQRHKHLLPLKQMERNRSPRLLLLPSSHPQRRRAQAFGQMR